MSLPQPPPPGGRHSVRIGLTGPIGCGKSTVARVLAARGAAIVDADALAREVTDLPEVREAIVRAFGAEVRLPDGSLDRAALGRLVFADEAKLRHLEGLTHPLVRQRIVRAVAAAEAAGAPAVTIEAIKLVEAGYATECDEVWLITCAAAEQRARLERRGLSRADAAQRIAAQGDLDARLRPVATRVIDSSGARTETESLVVAAYDAALAEARARSGPS